MFGIMKNAATRVGNNCHGQSGMLLMQFQLTGDFPCLPNACTRQQRYTVLGSVIVCRNLHMQYNSLNLKIFVLYSRPKKCLFRPEADLS